MRIYVNKSDLRSYGYSPELWNGNVICVIVPNDFHGGNKTYDPATNVWIPDEQCERTESELKHDYEVQRTIALNSAKENIGLLPTKLLLGTITYEEKESLMEWMQHIDELTKSQYPNPLPIKD